MGLGEGLGKGLGKGLGCGGTMLKYLLFLFNIIFFACGAAILGVCIWIQVDENAADYIDIVDNSNDNPILDVAIYTMTGVGAFIFLAGFFGFAGACCEVSWMLALYSGMVGLIFVLQVVAGILVAVFKDDLGADMKKGLAQQAFEYVGLDPSEGGTTLAWSRMQHEFKCCGGNDYTDYNSSSLFQREAIAAGEDWVVPKTCCVQAEGSFDAEEPNPRNYSQCNDDAKDGLTTSDELYTIGCYDGVVDWMEDKADILIGVAIGLAAFQVICIIFACCVRSGINSGEVYA